MYKRMEFQLLTTFINNLFVMTATISGAALTKFKASLIVAMFVAPTVYIVERINLWAIENADYVAIVMSAILIDHLLGSIRHSRWFDDDFSMFENIKGFFTKLTLVVMVGVLFEELHHLAEPYKFITGYTITIARITVFLYPFGSAIGNSRRISGGKFPPDTWFNAFERFVDQIINKNDSNGEN